MSGDVQPRKRKDKKKKKDDLGVEEPRGTAAALGEGDVFMHSYHDHGTGGHWCAKIIFFSLLAVLVTLIGLIILENRGLTELEANSVESRYSGVLEGWIEDAIDDHHDEHTLELKHHDDDENHPDDQVDETDAEEESLEEEIDHDGDDDESNEDEDQSHEIEDDDEEDESQNDDDDDDEEQNGDDEEDEIESDDEEDENQNDDDEEDGRQNDHDENDEKENDDEDDEIGNDDEEDDNQNDGDDYETHNDDDEGHDEDSDDEDNLKDGDHEDEEDTNYSYEDISKSNNDHDDDDDDEQKDDYVSKEMTSHYNYHGGDESKYDDGNESHEPNTEDEEDDQGDDDDDEEQEIEKIEKEFIDDEDSEEVTHKEKRDASKEDVKEDASNEDDGDEPPVEKISRPREGKPFVEIEEETPIKPVDTLAEEEAYEREQEELRRQEEEAPHSLWLKLCVGGALLAATHALVRRATRPDASETEETVREETPSLTDRRMTIIDEQISITQTPLTQAPRQIVDEEVFKRPAPVAQSAPIAKPKLEEEIVKEVVAKVLETPKIFAKKEEEKELYSDEEEEDEEEDVEEDNEVPQKTPAKNQEAEESEPEPEPEEVSDVEIIYDETVEEEEIPEEEVEEEEISDVDDTELLTRLEAKYGRLPEPERPGQYKGGGNSLEAEWPGEPSDAYWRSQLDTAEEEFRQGAWSSAASRAGGAGLARSARARWLRARALDRVAEQKRDNRVLSEAIAAYLHLLKMNEALSDERLLEVARRTIDRIQFRGTYLSAEPVYRLLIRRFPDDVNYRNNLTISFLMANRADLADEVLRETLRLWPNDRVALAHHGFVLKIHYNKLEEAVDALRKALEGDAGRANEPRFYYHLGDALLMLSRFDEAHEVHKRGAELGHFLSPAQRSLYNVPRLRSRPWWRVEDTPYVELARALEGSWREILKEGEAAVALYEQEKEGLKERGEWSQLDIFVRGREVGGRCARAPAVCAAIRGTGEGMSAGCRRGQVKFSMMTAGTHVRPHVGPTNCRLRMHLALSNTEGTHLRVDKEIRQWQAGKTLLFDDSFEHEVWHNGTGTRLVLIVDVWHPDLTAAERRRLPAI